MNKIIRAVYLWGNKDFNNIKFRVLTKTLSPVTSSIVSEGSGSLRAPLINNGMPSTMPRFDPKNPLDVNILPILYFLMISFVHQNFDS